MLILILISSISNVLGQNSDRTYRNHDHNYSTTYSYDVNEIIIHSDSTYTSKSWSVNSKKEWKTYKEYKPEISNGKITKNGNFITLTEYRNGNKTEYSWTIKICDKRLDFYYPNRNGKLRKTARFKRIFKTES